MTSSSVIGMVIRFASLLTMIRIPPMPISSTGLYTMHRLYTKRRARSRHFSLSLVRLLFPLNDTPSERTDGIIPQLFLNVKWNKRYLCICCIKSS